MPEEVLQLSVVDVARGPDVACACAVARADGAEWAAAEADLAGWVAAATRWATPARTRLDSVTLGAITLVRPP
jgi:hypothetical protein